MEENDKKMKEAQRNSYVTLSLFSSLVNGSFTKKRPLEWPFRGSLVRAGNMVCSHLTLTDTEFDSQHRFYDINYIAGDILGHGLGLGFQTLWLHCTVQNISHCTDSDSDPHSLPCVKDRNPSSYPYLTLSSAI